MHAPCACSGSARVGGNGRELEPAVNRGGHGAATRVRARPTPARGGPRAGGAARVPDARGLGTPERSLRWRDVRRMRRRARGSRNGHRRTGRGTAVGALVADSLGCSGRAVERNDRVRASGRPTRGVSRNLIESIAPEGMLRRVDTFSRLAERSAAPASTPAALFDARGPSRGTHLEKRQSR